MVFPTHKKLPTDIDISTHIPLKNVWNPIYCFTYVIHTVSKETECSGLWRRVCEEELVGDKNLIKEQISHH